MSEEKTGVFAKTGMAGLYVAAALGVAYDVMVGSPAFPSGWNPNVLVEAAILGFVQLAAWRALSGRGEKLFDVVGGLLWGVLAAWVVVYSGLPDPGRALGAMGVGVVALGTILGNRWCRNIWCFMAMLFVPGELAAAGFGFLDLPSSLTVWLCLPAAWLVLSLIGLVGAWRRASRLGKAKGEVHLLTGDEIKDLWGRGRIYEIFGAKAKPTLITVRQSAYQLLERFHGHREIEAIINQANEIMHADLYREEWEKSCRIKDKVASGIGAKTFGAKEKRIWGELWGEVEKKYHNKPDLMTPMIVDQMARRLATKYK